MNAMEIETMRSSADEAAALLAALANPNRLLLLCSLVGREMSVLALAEAVGMNQSALSQQLAKLRAMKLVATRRDGRTIYYRLASDEIIQLLDVLYGIYCSGEKAAKGDARLPEPAMPGA